MSTFGPAFVEQLDGLRLRTQMARIRDYMLGAGWKTLGEISAALDYPEASVSSQLRHLRKIQFGGYQVLKVRASAKGLYRYRVLPPLPKNAVQLKLMEEKQ